MKKLLFGLIAMVFITTFSFGQKKNGFEGLEIIKTEKIDFTNPIVKSFFKVTKINSVKEDLIFNTNKTELLTLKNNFQAIKFDIDNKNFNILYAVYNAKENDFIWFYVNNTKDRIELLSTEQEKITVFTNENGNVKIENIADKRSVFGACMDAVEEDFTNDLVGWLAWNLVPLNPAVAAIACQGCAKKWWPCPPAYTQTLNP